MNERLLELRRKINDPGYIDGALDVVAEKLAHTFEKEFEEETIVSRETVQTALESTRDGARIIERDPKTLRRHPKNDFPDVQGKKWQDFLESVRRTGVLHPVLIDSEFRILSGSQRTRACLELGIKVPTIQITQPLTEEVARHIIVVTNIGARSYSQAEFDSLWSEVYKDWARQLLESGMSRNKVAEKIAAESGLKKSTVNRKINQAINTELAAKWKDIDSLPIPDVKKTRAKRALKEANETLDRIERLLIHYRDCRKVVSEIVNPGAFGLDDVAVQKKEDKTSARTKLPDVGLLKFRGREKTKKKKARR